MGIYRDIIDVATDVVDVVKNKKIFSDGNGKRYTSIANMASEGTLQFPTLVSSSLDVDTLQMVCKALERNYATYVQVSLYLNQIIDGGEYSNIPEYLRKFHQNTDVKDTSRSLINGIDNLQNIITDNANELNSIFENDKFSSVSVVYEGSNGKLVANNKEQLTKLLDGVRTDILNNKFKPRKDVIYNFKDKELNAKYNSVVTEANAPKVDRTNNITIPNNILKDNDVKKANELIATTMHIRMKMKPEDGSPSFDVDFIIAIKATMHPIKSAEMISNMVSACKNNNKIFNFLRWTTGEISFFKDFLFGISEVKGDISQRSAGSSPWWLSLKRRSRLAKMSSAMFKNTLLPNATIVLSSDEVEYIRTEYGYDLHNPIFVDKIMNTYFLLGFVIVDVATQLVHFKFENSNDFQSVTFSGLEKENGSDAKKFKEMLKFMNRN